jgi:hypothetical protein
MHITTHDIEAAMQIPKRIFHALGYSGSISIGLIIGFLISAAQVDSSYLAEQIAALATITILALGISKIFKGASHQSIIVLGFIASAEIAYWIPIIDIHVVGILMDIALIAAAIYIYGFRRKPHGKTKEST